MVPAYHSQVTSSGERPRQTPLHAVHERLGATMTSFAGWQMPLRYASETAEHHAVRRAAGLFDLSHMGEILVNGPGAGAALDYALTGFLSGLRPGRARYTMICAEDGGVLDDLVVYRQGEDEFLVIANAANTDVVLASLRERAAARPATTRWSPSRGRRRPGSSPRWRAAWTWPRSSITRECSGRWRGARPG
jgi:aminomethyltransferase